MRGLIPSDVLGHPGHAGIGVASVATRGATNATIADGRGVETILDDEPRISTSDMSKKEGKKKQMFQFIFLRPWVLLDIVLGQHCVHPRSPNPG
jgi:hypothetical protein